MIHAVMTHEYQIFHHLEIPPCLTIQAFLVGLQLVGVGGYLLPSKWGGGGNTWEKDGKQTEKGYVQSSSGFDCAYPRWPRDPLFPIDGGSGGSPVGSFYQLHSRIGQPSTVVSTHFPQIETEIDRSLSAFPVTPSFLSIFSISNSCNLQFSFFSNSCKVQFVSCTHRCTICKLYFRIVELKMTFFEPSSSVHRSFSSAHPGPPDPLDGTTVKSLFGED